MTQYSNFKKPAFYVPFFDYMQSLGNINWDDSDWNDVHLLNPTRTHRRAIPLGDTWQKTITFKGHVKYSSIADEDGYVYIFVLGHNFYSAECHFSLEIQHGSNSGNYTNATTINNIVNGSTTVITPTDYNGFSIVKAKFENVDDVYGFKISIRNERNTNTNIRLGCVSLCSKWNPPHTPDLSLTMTREYDGVKTIQTKGGATLSDASYTRGGTFWATNYAWELGTNDYNQGQSFNAESSRTMGRRIWSMKFSYLTTENLMPKTESLNYYETSLTSNSDTILNSQSFFARVLNRIQGSHIPFIFQANDTDPNNNADQWAICRLDQKNVSITQATPELYSLSMNLKESW